MEVGIKEAKNNLSKLIDAAQNGESVYLTNHGKRVAQIITTPKPRTKNRGFGMFKDQPLLPEGWDSPEAEREFLDLFEALK